MLKFSKNHKKKRFPNLSKVLGQKNFKKNFEKTRKSRFNFSANTISHIPNLDETFLAIKDVLSEKGVLVIEDPSLLEVIKNNTYDQFYDEHVYVFQHYLFQKYLMNMI